MLLDDLEHAQLARRRGVRSAADFLGKIADGIGLYAFAVLAFEKPRKALRFRFFQRDLLHHHGDIFPNFLVDERLHLLNLLRRHGALKIEIEAQPLLRDIRALLIHVLGKHFFESRVQEMRGGVQIGRRFFMVGKTAGKLLLAARLALALMFLERRVIAV